MTQVSAGALLRGAATFLPLLKRFSCRGTGGSTHARYCYSVWLRHLILARAAGKQLPKSVAELGPGDSLGTGLAVLLCGADRYYALDALPHAATPRNLEVFEQLVDLFSRRAPIPDEAELPHVNPKLDNYDFPAEVLSDETMDRCLSPARLDAIRRLLRDPDGPRGPLEIRYVAPWHDASVLLPCAVDMVLSQAVMEHVEDIRGTYACLAEWMCPGGFMSHTIDFKCHNTASTWNGHWTLSDFTWKFVQGSRPYLINRLPCSAHLDEISRAGFSIASIRRTHGAGLRREALAARFRHLSDSDLETTGTFVQAFKPL